MKELIKKTKIVWIFILAISFIGCEDDDEATLPEIVASFVQTIDEDTGVVSFLNLSENADSYTWDFGDGTTSTLINPTKVYPTGNYAVVLKAENAAGASSTFEDQIVINIPLPINFPVNFDDPNVKYEITTFNGVAFEIVDNPDLSGSNTNATKVGAITNSGAVWEGLFFDLGMALDLTMLKSIQFNFWSDTPVDVLMKLEEGTGSDVEATASHGGTGWELIRFDFDSDASYSRITIFVDGPGTTAGTFYFDDIGQVETPAPVGPQTAAPTPPARDAADVISLFSDAYTSITVSEWSTGWDDADIEDFDADGDNTKKVTFGDSGGFLGVDFSANAFDATAFTHFHMDYWAADEITSGQVLNPKWSNHAGGAEVNAFEYTNPVSQSGQWVSLDIPITDFTIGDTTRDNVAQFILATANSLDEVYFDNIYFYKEAGSGGGGGSNSAVLLDFENNLAGVTAAEFETSGALISNPVSGGINTSANVYEAAYTNANQWWGGVGFVFDGGLDQATTVYKGKFYSTVAPTNVLFQVEVDGTGPTVGQVQEINTANEWVELTFTLENIPAGVNRILVRPDVGNQDGTKPNTGSLYIDDIAEVDSGSGGGGGTGGGNTDVVSIFHNDFTDIAINEWGPDWGPSSARIVDGTLNGSPAKVINMEADKVFAGIDFASSAFDATNFTTFHIDYKVDVLLPGQVFNIKLSNHEGGSGETSAIQYTHVPSSTDVNTLSIPLADFEAASDPANLVRNAIAQIVISAARANTSQGVNITIDNIYFSK